jgi:hypothetical protein
MREEENALAIGLVFMIYLAYRVGRWAGQRAEQKNLFRIISAQRITHKEQ